MGGKKQQDRANQGSHAEELAIHFLEATLSKTNFLRRKTLLCAKGDLFYVTTETR